jgi:two-component system OmpR family response regulator
VAISTVRQSQMTSRRPLVLVVEDDRQLLNLLCRLVTHAGYDSIAALDGTDALRAITGRVPDAAVIDFMLPGLSSSELITTLRLAWPSLPVILITATAATDEQLAQLTPVAWLRKPFFLDELQVLLERALENPPTLSRIHG